MTPTPRRPGVLFPVFLVLLIILLTFFCFEAEDFYTFTSSTLETASSVAPLSKESVLSVMDRKPEAFDTEVKYRTFFLTVPGAARVELLADFNRWGKDPIVLRPYKKGYFETSVALTGGEYKYVFLVDGKRVLDPTNTDRRTVNGNEVCIKTVR
jgi:1,4-alpha-glucan branching enzyme